MLGQHVSALVTRPWKSYMDVDPPREYLDSWKLTCAGVDTERHGDITDLHIDIEHQRHQAYSLLSTKG